MATIAKLGIKLEADGEAFSSSVDVAAQKAKKLEEQAKKTGDAAKKMGDDAAKAAKKAAEEARKAAEQRAKENSLAGRIESLNKTFGADSALGKIAGALTGGAFVGGLAVLANGFQKAVEGVATLERQLRKGEITHAEYKAEVVSSIPILGTFGKAMFGAFDMAAAGLARLRGEKGAKSFAVGIDELDEVLEKQKKAQEIFDSGQEMTESIRAEISDARLTGADKEINALVKQANETLKKAHAAYVESMKAGGGKLAEKQYEQQRELIGQKLKEDIERIEEAPLLEKAKENAKTIKDAMDKAAKDAEQSGMSDIEKTLDELKRAGATAGQLDFVRKHLETAEATKAAKEATKEAKKLADETAKAAETKAKDAAAKIRETIADMKKEIEQFNMSAADKEADDVKRGGGTAAQAQAASLLRQELEMLSKKKSIIESIETPQEKYNKQLKELNELQESGMLTQEQYARAAVENLEEFKRSQKSLERKPLGIESRGSAEAISNIRAADRAFRDRQATPQLDIQKKQLEEQKKQTEQNARILAGEGIIKFTVATL